MDDGISQASVRWTGARKNPTSEPFAVRLEREGLRLERQRLEVVQVNLGRVCNQACRHCHVEAGPGRTEHMAPATARRIVRLLAASPEVHTLDLTGGAPELNPSFRRLVRAATALSKKVIDRSNLTILLEDGQEDLAEFLARHGVRIVASLPCYTRDNVDRQRGAGVFDKSLRALRRLNRLGYGREGTGLELDLLHNPGGVGLPGETAALERDYQQRLRTDFGVVFNRLLTLTNMPIGRFRRNLEQDGRLTAYRHLLARQFNPAAAEKVMCRSLVSISWDGRLFDCDFNQMLELPVGNGRPSTPRTVWDLPSFSFFNDGSIAWGDHCYGCTAGWGSSCGGRLV